ncbi:MAG: hypothetical protein K2N05_12355 [Muribaculaceae bacterium]|nr:hypothetical protein [Muribaculaceae bacterium]
MESMNFIPYTSVGAIKFGESRSNVRFVMGAYKEYKKNKFSSNTLDDFGGCQVFYTKDNTVEAVEVYRNVELLYKGENLFNMNKEELISIFNDPQRKEDEYGITFPTVGVSITLVDGLPDSILMYQRGYM